MKRPVISCLIALALITTSPVYAAEPVAPPNPIADAFRDIGNLARMLAAGELSVLPTAKTVYPTGERPLVVITFKCPTEVIGLASPPIKLLHTAVDGATELLNQLKALPFDVQQVCQ